MTRQQKNSTAMKVAYDTYALLKGVDARTYVTPKGKPILWLWWSKEVVDLLDTKSVKRALAKNYILPSKTPMRGTVIKNLISMCIHHADSIRNASQEVIVLAHEKRLY